MGEEGRGFDGLSCIGNAVIACRTADPSVYNQSYAMGDPSGTIGAYRSCASKKMVAGLDNCIDNTRPHILGAPMRFEQSRHEGACGPKKPPVSDDGLRVLGMLRAILLSSAAEVRFIDSTCASNDPMAVSLACARNQSSLHFVTYQLQPRISISSQQ